MKLSTKVAKLFVYLNLTAWASFFVIFWLRAYEYKADGSVWAQSLGTWSDGAAHLTYISAMAYRLPTNLPIYMGKAFTYPFVSDLLSAMLVRLGVGVFSAYSLIGGLLSLILLFSLFQFYKHLLGSKIWAVISLDIFLLSGGVGIVKFLRDVNQKGVDLFWAIPQEYTLIDEWKIRWINIVTAELIPQRALLLALPLGLLVVWQLYWVLLGKYLSVRRGALAGFIVGIMPLVHAHTYIVLAIVSLWLFLVSLNRPEKRKFWLSYGTVSLLVSLPIIFFHILPASDTHFLRWYPGWLAGASQSNWLWWWFVNVGLFWPLAWIGWLGMEKHLKLFSFGFWLVFIVANLWIFQPYDWDNAKLITWSILALSPAVAISLQKFWRSGWVFKILSLLLFVSLTATGFLDVVRQLQPHTTVYMYGSQELELVDWVKNNTDPQAIFLTGQSHVHPIPTLTGRQILMGYQGWLWSYGIDFAQREQDVTQMYTAGDRELMKKYNVDYVVIGPDEINRFKNFGDFLSFDNAIYQSQDYRVYSVE